MTFKPTKQRQRKWVGEYLNDGVCPKSRNDYQFDGRISMSTACWEALDWLSETDITTLAEAWERCERPDWLMWMLYRMAPDRADYDKALALADKIRGSRYGSSKLRYVMHPNYTEWRARSSAIISYMERKFRVHGKDLSKVAKAKFCAMIRELWPNPWRMKR